MASVTCGVRHLGFGGLARRLARELYFDDGSECRWPPYDDDSGGLCSAAGSKSGLFPLGLALRAGLRRRRR